jgi:S-adenosylmethionine synthetase
MLAGLKLKTFSTAAAIYSMTTNYGHFGKVDDLDIITWEKTDKVAALKRAIK